MKFGFLFDNDGVLIDSSALHWLSWQILMREDKRLRMDEKQFVHGFGKRNDLILAEVLPHVAAAERASLAVRKEELFREYARGKIQLLPGMESFLQEVKEAGIPRIIASSTPIENLQMFLSSTVLGDYFDAFVSAEEVNEGKPAPDIFIEAARRLELRPEECVVFEDSKAGLKAGRQAGSFVVAIGSAHRQEELTDFDLYVPSARELKLHAVLDAFASWR